MMSTFQSLEPADMFLYTERGTVQMYQIKDLAIKRLTWIIPVGAMSSERYFKKEEAGGSKSGDLKWKQRLE